MSGLRAGPSPANKNNRTYIGIENGVTGSIGVITPGDYKMIPMFTKSEQNYTKSKQNITRVESNELLNFLSKYKKSDPMVVLERPMVNPGRFKATTSALRCLEAVLVCIETLGYPRLYIDSKEWQKVLLPSGLQKDELKKASLDIAKRLFPNIDYTVFKDGDGILITEFARRMGY